jgi:hypothetical protein
MRSLLFCLALGFAAAACHPGPIIDPGHKQSVGGTISGVVTTTDSMIAVVDRAVTITETKSGAHYQTTVAANGGYTIQVPEGTYHIEVELRGDETLKTRPGDTHINNGDLDPHRNFVITVTRARHLR